MTHADTATTPILRRMVPLLLAMAVGFLAVSTPLAVLALHVHDTLSDSPVVAGLVVGLQSVATIATRAAAGRMVDRAGSKPTLQRGLAVTALSGVISLAASLMPTPGTDLAMLLVARLSLGAGESLLVTGVLSWAIIRAGPGRAGLAMGWNGMAQYTALAAGAPIGFALFRAVGFAGVAVVAAALPLVGLAVIAPLAAPAPRDSRSTRIPIVGVARLIAVPGIALMLAGIGFAAIAVFASLDVVSRQWPHPDRALLAFGGCFVGVRLLLAGQPDRRGGPPVAAVSMAFEALGQVALWLAPGPGMALFGAGLTGAGCSLVFPSLGLVALRRVPDEARGVALGAFSAFQDAAMGLTGPLLGVLATVAGYPATYGVGALAAGCGAGVALVLWWLDLDKMRSL